MSCHAYYFKKKVSNLVSLNQLQSKYELAKLLGIKLQTLTYVLYKLDTNSLYTQFTIPKKNGEERIIQAPIPPLKSIQKSLASLLTNYSYEISQKNNLKANISHGFTRKKSIITNAKIHRNKRYVLNIDLKDFFLSFHFGRVRGYFEKNKYFKMSREVSTILAQLTCYNGALPQGAPTSPVITNLICQILDYKILKIAKRYKLDYTRYADDLTFSTNDKKFYDKYDSFKEKLNKEIVHSGFEINEKKTRLQFKDSKQEVTGLTVNQKLNVSKKMRKNTKAMAHQLYSTGEFTINGDVGTLNQLEGRFSYINQLEYFNNIDNGNNKKEKKHNLHNLNMREKEYQKFLYYKYFIGNDRPLIITEGKTDVRYLKAALKKYRRDYPLLITAASQRSNFKLTFLNRTSRLRYFLGIQKDGGDTFKNIYNLYTGGDGYPNYWRDLVLKYNIKPKNPVILIMDNEESDKKPLQKFLNYIKKSASKIDNNYRTTLSSKLSINVIGNLYLVIVPKLENMKDSEIEDLFSEEILNTRIGEKTFSRNDSSTKKTYGKEIFSKYILSNYHRLDFTNFEPLLDKLVEIIIKYTEI